MSGKERDALPDHHLILGDCLGPEGLSTLPDKSVGVVVTDAPYSERVHTNYGLEGRCDGHAPRDDIGFEPLTEIAAHRYMREFCRVAERWVVVFGDEYTMPWWRDAAGAHGEYVTKGLWIKTNPMPRMCGDRPGVGFEELSVSHALRAAGRMRWNGGGRCLLYRCDSVNGRGDGQLQKHPTEKPLRLMEAIISDFTDPGELVCDPFAGSGTTLVACKRLGRRAIGWERDATFWERAVRRLENTKQQYELIPRGPRPRQLKMGGMGGK